MTTFKEVAYKIFRTNLKRYLLYFLCSGFAVMVFFVYSTIYTNKSLMDSSQVKSSVSSMFIAPTIGLIIFSIFFIMYAHNSFNKFRRKEFGLFMVLGMTKTDIRKIILLENSLIAIFSLLAGLFFGTIFSRLFYLMTIKIINIENIPFSLTFQSYIYTIAFFVSVYILVIVLSVITTSKYEIVSLLKELRKKDKNLVNKPYFGFMGIFLIISSFIDIIKNFKNGNSTPLFRGLIICYIGIYLFISNIAWFISKIKSTNERKYFNNMVFLTNLKYSFGQTKKIIFLITLLVSITIFFSSISVLLMADSQRLAKAYNPYNIAFVQLFGKNKISEDDLNSIIKNGETPLTDYKTLEFIAKPQLTILSDRDLNSVLGTSIHADKGHFISLFQVLKDDGYAHETTAIKNISLEVGSKNIVYESQGAITKVIFNNIPILQNGQYLILNNQDYLDIKSKANSMQLGYIKLMNFKDWNKTKNIVSKLDMKLEKYNKDNTKRFFDNSNDDINMFKTVSRIDDYTQRKQSGAFSLFLFSFVGILFFVASGVILHFKLITEYDREKIKYKKLYKIGITQGEVNNMISKELKLIFFMPFLLGTFFAALYSFSLPVQSGKEIISTIYSITIGLIYLALQLIYYAFYKRGYVKKMLLSL